MNSHEVVRYSSLLADLLWDQAAARGPIAWASQAVQGTAEESVIEIMFRRSPSLKPAFRMPAEMMKNGVQQHLRRLFLSQPAGAQPRMPSMLAGMKQLGWAVLRRLLQKKRRHV